MAIGTVLLAPPPETFSLLMNVNNFHNYMQRVQLHGISNVKEQSLWALTSYPYLCPQPL